MDGTCKGMFEDGDKNKLPQQIRVLKQGTLSIYQDVLGLLEARKVSRKFLDVYGKKQGEGLRHGTNCFEDLENVRPRMKGIIDTLLEDHKLYVLVKLPGKKTRRRDCLLGFAEIQFRGYNSLSP